MRKLFVGFAALAATSLLLVLLPSGRALSQQILEVAVNNFTEVQTVAGAVAVPQPVPHSSTFRQLDVVVPPIPRGETTNLIAADDLLVADGFTGVTLSLQGTVKGALGKAGQIGAVLLPDEEAIERAFDEEGLLLLPLEVFAVLARKEIDTFSAQQQFAIGFPRYKIYFYNSTDKSVEVNLYGYLTH